MLEIRCPVPRNQTLAPVDLSCCAARNLFDYIKRKLGIYPSVEWECGSSREVELIGTLDAGTSSVVSYYQLGKQVWSRDVATELHEFTLYCLEQLLERQPTAIEMPVYCDRPSETLNPMATALQLAERHALSNTGKLSRFAYDVPQAFAMALKLKRQWMRGEASQSEIKRITDSVLDATKHFWPSNFCLRVNALQTTCWCVLSALNLESPWLGAAGCAQSTASAIAMLAACETIDCASNASPDLVWEGALIGAESFGRGNGCPQAFDSKVESRASKIMDQIRGQWMERLTQKLESALKPTVA